MQIVVESLVSSSSFGSSSFGSSSSFVGRAGALDPGRGLAHCVQGYSSVRHIHTREASDVHYTVGKAEAHGFSGITFLKDFVC